MLRSRERGGSSGPHRVPASGGAHGVPGSWALCQHIRRPRSPQSSWAAARAGGPWARPPWGGSWLWGQALAVPCGVRSSQRGKAWKPLASPCAQAAVPKKPLPRGHNDRALVAPWEGWGDPRASDTVPSGVAEVPQSGVLPYKGNPFPRGDDGVTPAQYGSTDTRGE